MNDFFWWFKQALIALLSVAFFVFGVQILIASYTLDNPFNFVMVFFSSSLIILISMVGILYPVMQVYAMFKTRQ